MEINSTQQKKVIVRNFKSWNRHQFGVFQRNFTEKLISWKRGFENLNIELLVGWPIWKTSYVFCYHVRSVVQRNFWN